MKKRIITAFGMAVVFVPVLFFTDTFALPLACAVLSGFAAYEILDCCGIRKNIHMTVFSVLFAALNGSAEAARVAMRTMSKVKRKVGFTDVR